MSRRLANEGRYSRRRQVARIAPDLIAQRPAITPVAQRAVERTIDQRGAQPRPQFLTPANIVVAAIDETLRRKHAEANRDSNTEPPQRVLEARLLARHRMVSGPRRQRNMEITHSTVRPSLRILRPTKR